MKTVTFYFDYLSPFSFFAWKRMSELKQACPGIQLVYKPVSLGSLLNHWGIKGPGEVEPKRIFLLKTALRYAARNKLEFTTPKTHPFNPLYALRMSLASVAQADQEKVIDTFWTAGWQTRIDMGEPDELKKVLSESGLDAEALFEKSFLKESKTELKKNIEEAIGLGAFGVPTFIYEGELFWGNDGISDLIATIQGKDLLDKAKLQTLVDSTPRAAAQSL